jgi:pimeloyl-ACP methyl ester carboxylesterase
VHSTLLYGYNHSSIVHITEADSILNRVTKLLTYLDQHHHSENWEQFQIAPGKPKWSQIVVAGHSFGGAQAALIAMLYEVPRVVMFASPVDAVNVNSVVESAQWLHRPHATPIDRYFGFRHLKDDQFKAGTQANWTTMGMMGSPTLVDVPATPPYASPPPHQLTSNSITSNAHEAVVRDEASYKQVWQYLIGA